MFALFRKASIKQPLNIHLESMTYPHRIAETYNHYKELEKNPTWYMQNIQETINRNAKEYETIKNNKLHRKDILLLLTTYNNDPLINNKFNQLLSSLHPTQLAEFKKIFEI